MQRTGAANRIRTCDPVITNDVLYQLSYCGGPCGFAFADGAENAQLLISGTVPLGKINAPPVVDDISSPSA